MDTASSARLPKTILVLPNLPAEVWDKVFSYLLVEDRNNIRLACHRFHQIATREARLKIEKMVLYGDRNTNAAIKFFFSRRYIDKLGTSNSIRPT